MRGFSLMLTFGAVAFGAACDSADSPPGTTSATTNSASSGPGGTGGSGGGTGEGASGGGGAGGGACVNSLDPSAPVSDRLSDTGLFSDTANQTLAPHVQRFTPRWVLWSDDAAKDRYVYVPECEPIDTSDMNDWSLPVGTRLWKSFTRDGKLIETRLTQRVGPGAYDWVMTSYVWNDQGTDALRTPEGLADAKGTDHDVPSEAACRQCHGALEFEGGGRPSRALGFSALQLAHDGDGVTLDDLVQAGKLTAPPTGPVEIPGDAVAVAALGSLHVNCGPCHNASADAVPQTDLNLWIDVGAATVDQTTAYQSAVGQPNQLFADQGVSGRIVPGDASQSSVWFRMSQRGNNAAMPPVGSEVVDADGLAAVQAWIEALP